MLVVGSTRFGEGDLETALARLNGDGTIDTTFGDQGEVTSASLIAFTAALQSNGMIVVAGYEPTRCDECGPLMLARYTSLGILDSSFGDGGLVVTHFEPREGPEFAFASSLVVQPDGKLVAAGDVDLGTNASMALFRYLGTPLSSVCGDADRNGTVTVTDGVQALRAAAGLSGVCVATTCDVDGNGDVTVTDGVNILRTAAGLRVDLRCTS
jgi:uncharacterized delta-60 repeat protein